jgi:hypothetical protein
MELMERLKAQAAQSKQGVDAYYADILDIPAHRDARTDDYVTTQTQILRLQNPAARIVDDPNALYMDSSFNNSPYVLEFLESGAPRFTFSGSRSGADTRRPSGVLDASLLELWNGEMRALSEKEMSGAPLSGDEEELLRAYQEYFGGRTGMAEGGVVLPQDEQVGIGGLFADKLGMSDPPSFPVPINARQQSAIRQSGRQDFEGRDQFYEPGAANFAERLMLEYDYPSEFDAEGNREVIDIAGEQRHARPEGRRDLPTPQELEDVRAHMLGTALAAKGYGESGSRFMGSVNEGIFGFHQGRRDKVMDNRNNAVGLDLFRQAGIEATPQQLTEMVDDAIFSQLDRIMSRPPQERNFRSPETGPDLYFPRDERGNFATQY